MANRAQWIAATRPKTLPAAVAPVLVGSALAQNAGMFDPTLAALAAIVALALQIGVNYANDYSDGIRGTDGVRVGPTRLVGQGLASAVEVRRMAFLAFGAACVAGLAIVAITGNGWLVLIGLLAIASAWFYTGGTQPYGYMGLGELFVFVWFGLVAVVGTLFIQTASLADWRGWVLGAGSGALSCALLVVNNLRDLPTDEAVGKRTLAVMLGARRTRLFYAALLIAGMGSPVALVASAGTLRWIELLYVVPFLVAHRTARSVLAGASGTALLPILAGTGRVQLAWACCISAALVF